jgi:hypothetical protein
MAGSYPLSPALQSGFTHALQIRADVKRFRSGKEQRYAISGLLNSFKLAYQHLTWSEVVGLRDFFISQKGAFDSSWSLTMRDPATLSDRSYENMAFDSDAFEYTETQTGRYSVSLAASQTVGEAVTVDPQAAYPVLSTGARVQLPNRVGLRYQTLRNDLECGQRIAYYTWASPLRTMNCEYGLITDAEVQSIVTHYLKAGGPVHPFSFTDPDSGAVYAVCRFSPEPITITRISPNINRMTVGIEEYAA